MNNKTPAHKIKAFERKQYIISGLCLLIFCGVSVVFNALHLQKVAEENTRFLSRMVKIGDFREATLILQEARLSSFTTIHYKSTQPGRSFVIPPKAEVFKDQSFWKTASRDSIRVPIQSSISSGTTDEIVFEFERFRLIPYAFLIWLILNLVSIPQTRFLKRKLIEQFDRDLEIEKKLAKSEVAQQVRHNLRTPLAALMRIPKKLPEAVGNDRELLELTISQIKELIAKLDDRPIGELSEEFESDLYSTLLQAKRELTLYVSKTIDFQYEVDDMICSTLVSHVPVELRAILGNIVTNSIEAIDLSGKIVVRAKDAGGEVEISVIDNGKGIDPKNVPYVFEKNFSHGKISGSGIGLSHAKENIEAWGGSVKLESVLGIGTTVRIRLPTKDRAAWYLPRLKLSADSRIYVLDDKETGRALWKLKFHDTDLLKRTKFMSQGQELLSEQQDIQIQPNLCTFLFDFDLGADDTGLDWLQKAPPTATRCLVTGHFDNSEVQAACVRHGVYLIPKSQILDMPLVVR
tara:strand:+ start:44150 stop:45706 length:1557 start_codon:yes stop_codon:yes gene_type:complete